MMHLSVLLFFSDIDLKDRLINYKTLAVHAHAHTHTSKEIIKLKGKSRHRHGISIINTL